MKKIYKLWMAVACVTCICASCSYLDFDESTARTKDETYAEFESVRQLISAVYSYLPQDFGAIGNALREAATDNAVYTWSTSSVYRIYENTWSALNTIDDVWGNMYTAIRTANSYLENYDEEYFKRYEWNDDYKEEIKKFRMYPYEVRALRAYYYFELVKRYGDVPLVTRTLELNEVNELTRTAFHEVIDYIVSELDAVAPELPLNHTDFFLETGRVTRGMAMALKSRVLLYAASPLHNPDGNKERWKRAATAAYDVIKSGYYTLPNINNDPLYDINGAMEVLKSAQLIFERRNGNDNSFERRNLPIGFEGGNSGNTPTQNLVDAYEMTDGTPFDWNNPDHVKYPYEDAGRKPVRDPRFYKTVVYNGSRLMSTNVETFEGGKNGAPLTGATLTGYYLRKYINETTSLDPANPIQKPHHYILFRYAEILLNYAEAMAEWQSADYSDSGFPLSAREALNQVRSAANMPAVQDNGTDFINRLRNERRIELAFEDHRFWDIRRWKTGEVVKDIYGIQITKGGEHTKVKVQERIWENKMYLYPIAQQEVYKNPNLGQNEGWENK